MQIAHATTRKLIEVKGISEQKILKLKETIKAQQLVSLGFQTASSKLECMKDIITISTGNAIDTEASTKNFEKLNIVQDPLTSTICWEEVSRLVPSQRYLANFELEKHNSVIHCASQHRDP